MTRLGAILFLAVSASFSARAQTTVFSDDFNTATSSTALNSLQPDITDTGGLAWTAGSGITESGGVANLASGMENASLSLNLTNVQSVTLNASVTLTAGSMIDLFFASSAPAGSSPGTGQLSLQVHKTTISLYDGLSTIDTSVAATSGTTYNLSFTYDIADGTVSATVGGTPAGVGSYAISSSDSLLTGITTLYFGFGSSLGAGTVDNFSAVQTTTSTSTTSATPEPSTWLLLGLSLGAGIGIVRKRQSVANF